MLSSQKLRRAIIAVCALGIFFAIIGRQEISWLFFVADVVLMGLLTSTREDNITLRVRNLFEDNLQVNEYLDKMKTDEPFAKAVEYVYSLSPHGLLKFARLIVELRYNCDQKFLKQFADIFRKEQP